MKKILWKLTICGIIQRSGPFQPVGGGGGGGGGGGSQPPAPPPPPPSLRVSTGTLKLISGTYFVLLNVSGATLIWEKYIFKVKHCSTLLWEHLCCHLYAAADAMQIFGFDENSRNLHMNYGWNEGRAFTGCNCYMLWCLRCLWFISMWKVVTSEIRTRGDWTLSMHPPSSCVNSRILIKSKKIWIALAVACRKQQGWLTRELKQCFALKLYFPKAKQLQTRQVAQNMCKR